MADDHETRAGMLSGLVAVAMLVALSLMAMTALASYDVREQIAILSPIDAPVGIAISLNEP
jgi:hypothetical protein